MNYKSINGKEVLDTDGYAIGKIDDIDFDIEKGIINHLIMKSGFTTRRPITLDKIMSIGDKAILKVRKVDLNLK